ncbi:hypothetical protein EJ04DRAFT_516759 [Polyplosphaeria fusca]|uniref:Uncharacterized protein n=1 Tax=Polyplosphaeria fusca TaxID=682080 RepID=A0A9P4QMQ8_9PLEO|nr:hypothetical protein EJ04DRAFT_516759 [Polyplosphaeria fusca]
MPHLAANSAPATSPLQTSTTATGSSPRPASAPLSHHHGASIGDSTPAAIVPPALTPETTTRQSVSLGVLSTLWGSSDSPTATSQPPLRDTPVPAIVTHAPSPDAQEPPVDLIASTSSVPSATTTLTDTLPPTQSAALRALNAPAFQSSTKSKTAKSASSRTTLSSQPVVVRTYSGSRHNSRPSSGLNSPRLFPNMNGQSPRTPSPLSTGLAGRGDRLPSVDDFSFSAILRAVDPEIRDAIEAIAEICARSRYSLADEYDAHLPPQGEITNVGPSWASGMGGMAGRGRISRIGQGWSAGENTLTAVPEASSSSERLAGGSRPSTTAGSGRKRSQSAYGSLKSVISGGSGKHRAEGLESTDVDEQAHHGPQWAVHAASSSTTTHPAITLVNVPQTSNQLSLEMSSTITAIPEADEDQPEPRPRTAQPSQTPRHRRNISNVSLPNPRPRPSTLSSLASWLPWPRTAGGSEPSSQDIALVETRLREMLESSRASGCETGKAPISVS